MTSTFNSPDRVHDIRCPRCGQTGLLEWEKLPEPHPNALIRIVGDFYERISKKPPYGIELVCNGCGTVQPKPV